MTQESTKNSCIVQSVEELHRYKLVYAVREAEERYAELLSLSSAALTPKSEEVRKIELPAIQQVQRANCATLEDLYADVARGDFKFPEKDYHLALRDSLAQILLGCVLRQTVSGKLTLQGARQQSDLPSALVSVATCSADQSLAAFAVVLDYFPEHQFEDILSVVEVLVTLQDFKQISAEKLGGYIEDWPLYNIRLDTVSTSYAPSELIAIQLYQDQAPELVNKDSITDRLAQLRKDLVDYYTVALAFQAKAWDTGGKRLREGILETLPSPAFHLRDTRYIQHPRGETYDSRSVH